MSDRKAVSTHGRLPSVHARKQPPPVLRGGGGSKVSGKYEDAWNQFTLLDLVTGLAHRMLPEPPGSARHGFEFWVDRADRREWHQVKYQRGQLGKWTFDALKKEKVLVRFRDKLHGEANAACCFV